MTDLSQTIAPRSDQLNSDDLIGGPRTITITKVSACPDSAEQPIAVSFEGDGGKPYKPCKSMRRVLVQAWGADGAAFVGRRLTLYRDPKVKFGGMEVGGIRISHMSHIDREMVMALTETRAKRTPYKVRPLKDEAPRQYGQSPDQAQAAARAAAMRGTEAFREWWASDEGKAARESCKPIMAELKSYCDQADESAATDDPFGPSEDDLARAEREALEEIERQNREAAE